MRRRKEKNNDRGRTEMQQTARGVRARVVGAQGEEQNMGEFEGEYEAENYCGFPLFSFRPQQHRAAAFQCAGVGDLPWRLELCNGVSRRSSRSAASSASEEAEGGGGRLERICCPRTGRVCSFAMTPPLLPAASRRPSSRCPASFMIRL